MPQLHLTDLSVRSLKGSAKNPKFFDTKTPGFGIRCGLTRKTWVVMRGKNRELITIGHYPDLSLSEARTEAKKLLSQPTEPKQVRITFAEARQQFLDSNYQDSTSRWPHIVKLTLKRDFKTLDHRQLADITDQDIKKALDAIKGESARLHAYRIARTFFVWATRPPRRYLTLSPMHGYPPPGKDKKGTRTLTDDELKAIWEASGTGSRAVFRLLILWGTRNEETTRLERAWRKNDVLTIPGEATKNGRDHSIPLLPLAASVLDERPNTGRFYFPGRYSPDTSLTPGSLNRMRAEIQAETGTSGWQARDLRRTFRSNIARLGVPREICEVLINHAPPVLDAIYDRYDRLEEKRQALAKYDTFMVKLLGLGIIPGTRRDGFDKEPRDGTATEQEGSS